MKEIEKLKTLAALHTHTHTHTHTGSFRGYLEYNKIEKEDIKTHGIYMLFSI